jgi:hypothetical protein
MSLGAYFGSTKITQGAGGLGQGPLQAYADGVVGGNAASAETPGPLQSYADGSLGSAPLQAFADGVVGGSAANPDMPGSLFAYEDGTLGPASRGAPYADAPDGGVFGGGGGGGSADSGSIEMADHPAPVLSYQDGVFGGRGGTCGLGDSVGPLRAFQDGSLGDDDAGGTPISVFGQGIFGEHGDGMNRFGPLRSFHDGSLGADAAPPALDLGDEQTLMEVKALIGIMSAEQTATEAGQKVYPPEFYKSGIWEPNASALWQYFVSKTADFSGKTVSESGGNQTWPNATGIGYILSILGTPTADNPYGEKWLKEQTPALYAWLSAVLAGKGGQQPVVLAPYLSLTDKVKGQRASGGGVAKASMMAWYGLGAAALLGLALVFRKKR